MEKNIRSLFGNIKKRKHPKITNQGKLLQGKMSHSTVSKCNTCAMSFPINSYTVRLQQSTIKSTFNKAPIESKCC